MDNPVSVPVVTPQVIVEQPKQNNFIVILLSVLLLLVVSVAGFFAFQTQKLVKELTLLKSESAPIATSEPTIEPVATDSSAVDPTANWKTYTNTKYGYTLKYPSNLTVGENGMASGNANETTAVAIYQEGKTTLESPRLTVSVRLDSKELESLSHEHFQKVSVTKLTNSEKETASKNLGLLISDPKIVNNYTKSIFFGLDAYKYSVNSNTVDDGAAEYLVPSETHNYIWLDFSNKHYLIAYTDNLIMNQILSTFKFTY